MKIRIVLIAMVLSFVCIACTKENIIVKFDPISNFPHGEVVEMDFNMTNSVFDGLRLPDSGGFVFNFTITNPQNEVYYYKIYYQNCSYKFPDSDTLSYENFYGSWQDPHTTFKKMNSNTVTDSFAIVGNPRNEKKYYSEPFPPQVTKESISKMEQTIRRDSKWYEAIQEKAKKNKVSTDEQLYRDALWTIQTNESQDSSYNRRERNNPRTGEYEFMIVVAKKSALKKIPSYVQDISKTNDGKFVNPFDYFLNKKGGKIKGVYVMVSQRHIKARAKYDLSQGVYLNLATFPGKSSNICTTNRVSNDDKAYRYAQFEQYFHTISQDRYINQIQKLEDIYSSNYTLQDYLKDNITKHPRKKIHPSIASTLGKDIRCQNSTISLINPGSTSLKNAVKQSVGIRARVGFTYGRFIYKIKFPPLLNKNGVYNGITNAAWLIYQSEQKWNMRRIPKTAYVTNDANNQKAQITKTNNYSEIDIEMIKTSKYWSSLETNKKGYKPLRDNKIIFASTNWDMACNDNGFIDKKHLRFSKTNKGKTFEYNRWYPTYRALTSRVELSNDIFSSAYYYIIEWTPKSITWYVGKDMNHLEIVGYMDDSFTSIPNNQMVPIITQEYHYSEFWPPIIFEQGSIPYPTKDAIGTVYSLVVE